VGRRSVAVIALDTNVLVRAFAGDDPRQTPIARAFMSELTEESPGFISLIVVVELYWVLRRALGVPADAVHSMFDAVMRAVELEIEDGESVNEALEQARRGADFADALIDATSRLYGATRTVTFDRDAAERFGWHVLG